MIDTITESIFGNYNIQISVFLKVTSYKTNIIIKHNMSFVRSQCSNSFYFLSRQNRIHAYD